MVFTSNWESDKVKKWEGVIDSFNPSTTGRKPVKETVTESHLVDQMMENFLENTSLMLICLRTLCASSTLI